MKFLTKYFGGGKHLKSAGHYIEYLDKHINASFQFDIFRERLVDIQISRQEMFSSLNYEISDPKSYALLLAFTAHQKNNDASLKRFKSSYLFQESTALSLTSENDRYIIKIERNNQKLFDTIKFAAENIYCYDNSTEISYAFHLFDQKERSGLLSQYIGDNSIKWGNVTK
jgi:hypothetical protein